MFKPRNQDILTTELARTLERLLGKLVCMDGSNANIAASKTNYVVGGYTYIVELPGKRYAFWFGINGHRLFYITYVAIEQAAAKAAFKFCIGGAGKVGWEFNFEPTGQEGILAIWGSCMTDQNKPLATLSESVRVNGAPRVEVTDHGRYWMTDVAMMTQSFVRTSERLNFVCPNSILPAPL